VAAKGDQRRLPVEHAPLDDPIWCTSNHCTIARYCIMCALRRIDITHYMCGYSKVMSKVGSQLVQ